MRKSKTSAASASFHRTNGRIDFLAAREQILDYLAAHSMGRQGEIAKEVGLRREKICVYANQRAGLSDVSILQVLHDWMLQDKRLHGRD